MGPTYDSIMNDFAHHAPGPGVGELHNEARTKFRDMALWVLENVPPGAARSTAIAKLREGMMWTNGAIACDTHTSLAETPHNS